MEFEVKALGMPGLPLGELVLSRLLGALGMMCSQAHTGLEDYNDIRKPVSQIFMSQFLLDSQTYQLAMD
jgi:hypothetical protein